MVLSIIVSLFGNKSAVDNEARKRYEEADFIPEGDEIETEQLVFRWTQSYELFRCCRCIARDSQSGPYYCGRRATKVAGGPSVYVGLCDKHANDLPDTLRFATQRVPKTMSQ